MPPSYGPLITRQAPACLPLQTLVLEALVYLHRQQSSISTAPRGSTLTEIRDHLLFAHEELRPDVAAFERSLISELLRGTSAGLWSAVYTQDGDNTHPTTTTATTTIAVAPASTSNPTTIATSTISYSNAEHDVHIVRFRPQQEDVSTSRVRVYKKPSDKRLRARASLLGMGRCSRARSRSRSGEYFSGGASRVVDACGHGCGHAGAGVIEGVKGLSIGGDS